MTRPKPSTAPSNVTPMLPNVSVRLSSASAWRLRRTISCSKPKSVSIMNRAVKADTPAKSQYSWGPRNGPEAAPINPSPLLSRVSDGQESGIPKIRLGQRNPPSGDQAFQRASPSRFTFNLTSAASRTAMRGNRNRSAASRVKPNSVVSA